MQCVLNNLKEVPTLSKHLNSLESQKTKNRKKKPKPENITEEICEKEAEKEPLSTRNLLFLESDNFLQSRFSPNYLVQFTLHFHGTLLIIGCFGYDQNHRAR